MLCVYRFGIVHLAQSLVVIYKYSIDTSKSQPSLISRCANLAAAGRALNTGPVPAGIYGLA